MAGRFPANPARDAWRRAVEEVAQKAREVLTESHGRIDQAVKLVLAGDVQLHTDGTATVASQTNGQAAYHVNGACECKDFAKAPANFCKHRLAFGIAKRATTLTQERLQTTPAAHGTPTPDITPPAAAAAPREDVSSVSPLPEAPASCNVHVDVAGRKVQITLRDSNEQRLLERLAVLLAQFPASEAHAVPANGTPAAQPTCRYHGTQNMRPSKFGKDRWVCSVKDTEGEWCNQSWPRKGPTGGNVR
jgi:hypothetical protein